MQTAKLTPIEAKTQADYDAIAPAFALSRKELVWPEVEDAIARLPAGAHMLDIGCGTGRLCPSAMTRGLHYTGIDISDEELKAARAACPQGTFLQSSMLDLPFADESYDAVFHVAALHHLLTKEERQRAAQQAWRVLKPGGILVVTVMGLWLPKYWSLFWGKTLPPDLDPTLIKHLKRSDIFLPWSWKVTKPVYRYYHAFRAGELRRLFAFPGAVIESCGYVSHGQRGWPWQGRNLVLMLRKSL